MDSFRSYQVRKYSFKTDMSNGLSTQQSIYNLHDTAPLPDKTFDTENKQTIIGDNDGGDDEEE